MLLAALLLVTLATPVLADGPDGDVVIWGDSYTLESGEKVRGDLVVYGGNVTLEEDSEVAGDVTVFGGNATLSGEVDGDVTVWGGNVHIRSTATVRGKVVSVGGTVKRDKGADVRGGEVEGWPALPVPSLPRPPETPRVPVPPTIRTQRSWHSEALRRIGNAFRSAFGIGVMVVLGILVVAFLPRHTQTVAETMVKAPLQSLLSGLAGLIGGSLVLLILVVIAAVLIATICLAPVGLALLLPLLVAGVAVLFGWIAAGLLLGVKVLRALLKKEPNQVVAVAVGIVLLSLVSMTPCIGWFLALAVVTWSLGAVIYSLFGTREELDAHGEAYDPRMDQL